MSSFVDIRMPQRICEQFSGGPTFATSLARARSGYTKTNIDRPDPLWAYEASAMLKDTPTRLLLTAFYLAVFGMGNTFRFRDMGHYWTGCDVYGGLGDISPLAPSAIPAFATGTGGLFTFQLFVPYDFAGIVTTWRKITKPAKINSDNPGYTGPRFWVNNGTADILITPGSGWTLDYSTGLVTFAVAPGAGKAIKWAGLFDVHARWQDDAMVLALLESPEAGTMKIRVMEEMAA